MAPTTEEIDTAIAEEAVVYIFGKQPTGVRSPEVVQIGKHLVW